MGWFYVRPTWSNHGLILREHSHNILMVWFYMSSFTRTYSLQYTQVGFL